MAGTGNKLVQKITRQSDRQIHFFTSKMKKKHQKKQSGYFLNKRCLFRKMFIFLCN